MNNEINVNHHNSIIEISETFERKASKYGSEAYSMLLSVTNNFPTYRINVIKSKRKLNTFKGLNYNYINLYLEKHNDKEGLNEFNTLVEGKTNYLEIKKWFFDRYPNLAKCTSKADLILAA